MKKNYKNVTKKWLENKNPNSHKVKDMNYFEYKKVKYIVDGKNVVLDYSEKEKEVAMWLENTFGGEIYMVPRVNFPKGIGSPDYVWNNESWDLKVIGPKANSKCRAIDNIVKTTKKQSKNIILDISYCKLKRSSIIKQVKKVYCTTGRDWIKYIMIIKNYHLIKVYMRK